MSDSQTRTASGVAFVPEVGTEPHAASGIAPLVHDSPSGPSSASLSRGMRKASLWVIFVLVASYTFLDYSAYRTDYHLHPEIYDRFLRGEGTAPAQYRIGLIFAAKVLHSVLHLGYLHSLALFDFLFAIVAALLLRSVLAGTEVFRAAASGSRWMRLFVMLGLLSFYFSWSLWYQRPETMACAFFVAANLYLLSASRSWVLLVGGLVVLSAWQGFVRADVAILFHFGLFVYILLRGSKGFFAPRAVLLGISFVCCVIPAAILWVLMHKVFPHATYGDAKVFQLILNLNPMQLIPFLLFLAPTLYTYRRALSRFSSLGGPQAALLLSGVLYLCSWVLVGRVEEVRIFVPFAMALIPLSANLVAEEVADPS